MLSVSPKQLFSRVGQAHEFELAMIKQGVRATSIQDVIDGKLSISFTHVVKTDSLNMKQLLSWLRKNKLDSKLPGGLEKQIAEQVKFYRNFYGKNSLVDTAKIRVDARRLPAIKAGLEAGCLNYAMLKVMPDVLSKVEAQMTSAEFFYEKLAKPLKKDGFKIWAENGTDRWTKLTLAELLQRCNPVEPEEFDSEAFRRDWISEEIRVIEKRGSSPKVEAGTVELIFTSNLPDIPSEQRIVSKSGESVTLDDRSYVSAIAKNVRVLSHEEGIILASQLYASGKTCLARNTWEWRRDVVDHRDKGTKPGVSVAAANSDDSEFLLSSIGAGYSSSDCRVRLAL